MERSKPVVRFHLLFFEMELNLLGCNCNIFKEK